MEEKLHVNGKSATKINARMVRSSVNAVLLNCEGDEEWFPRSTVEYDHKEHIALVQDWIYKQKFPNG